MRFGERRQSGFASRAERYRRMQLWRTVTLYEIWILLPARARHRRSAARRAARYRLRVVELLYFKFMMLPADYATLRLRH